MKRSSDGSLIDLRHPDSWRKRRPLLIAHRGGVIGPGSPENSLAAIRLAASDGYDMVELDVTRSKDGEPVMFHGVGGRLRGTSVRDGFPTEFTRGELSAIQYDGSHERIATLAEGLEVCAAHRLGVMLDIKVSHRLDLDAATGRPLLERIGELLAGFELTSATMTISRHWRIDEILGDRVLHAMGEEELRQVAEGHVSDLTGRFWFGIPRKLPASLIDPIQRAGALVIPAVNSFRYRPQTKQTEPWADIQRLLAAGVDGFQIDSVFRAAFPAMH